MVYFFLVEFIDNSRDWLTLNKSWGFFPEGVG